MLWLMEVIFDKSILIHKGRIRAQHIRTERVPFSEKHHVRKNHFEDHKIGLVIHREYRKHPKRLRTNFFRMRLLVL